MLREHRVRTLDDRVDLIKRMVWDGDAAFRHGSPEGGLHDARMRQIGLEVTKSCPARNDMCELDAIYQFVKRNTRYTGDISFKDTFQSAWRTLQYGGGDCFDFSTKIICRSRSSGMYELVRLGELRFVWPHYEALSYNFRAMRHEFRPIVNFQDKGRRNVLKARLSNGTDIIATSDHKFWALDGDRAGRFKVEPRTLGEYMEMRARPARTRHEHTRILQAAWIPSLDLCEPTAAEVYLAGIYAAEGTSNEEKRSETSIGQMRPDIRRKIETAIRAVGASARPEYNQFRLHVRTDDGALVDTLREQGTNSFNMRLPPHMLSGTRRTVENLVGAHGDGDAYHPKPGSVWHKKVSAIYATSSDGLAEDLRLGLLQLGRPFYLQHQKNHQGVGDKPIWRLYEWKSPGMLRRTEALQEMLPGLRYGYVEDVAPAGRAPVGCITVEENHNFFLADGTLASNCDDHAALVAVLAMENGFTCKFRITSNTGATWDHIFCVVGVPKIAPRRWVPLDTTLPRGQVGTHPPMAKYKDFEIGVPK